MPPKGKKGRRGKGDDSDDDFFASLPGKGGGGDEATKPAPAATTGANSNPAGAAAAGSKKDKKQQQKGGAKRRNDSDDEDPLAIMKKMAQQSDDDSDGDAGGRRGAPPKPAPTNNNGKGGGGAQQKKGGGGGNQKKGGRGGRNDDDDTDEDPLAKMKALAVADEDDDNDDDDDDDVPAPVSVPVYVKAVGATPKPQEQQQQQKQKPTDSDGARREEPTPAHAPASSAAPASAIATVTATATAAETSTAATTATTATATAVEVEVIAAAAPPKAEDKPTPSHASASAPSPTPVAEPAPAPVTTKPKSKLELKLDKARQEKALADAKAAAEAIVKAQEAAEAAEKQRKLDEEAAAARAQAAAETAAVEAQRKAAQPADAQGEAGSNAAKAAADAADAAAAAAAALTDAEKEARMRATLYGDDVFSEYGNPAAAAAAVGNDDEDDDDGGAGGGKGKKGLSNKQKRKLAKEAEAKEREMEYNRASLLKSMQGAQFAVSQSIVDPNDPQWQNMLDIIIPSLSISAHNKELFVNAELNIVHGRRYGLVGPNGAGKSTLLKMIAAGELKVPPRVDFLYVEQEVMADETPAVDAVLKADRERWALVQEEQQLLADLEKAPDEAKDARLGEVYEQLAQINAASSESRARRILFGLGFDAEMQVRPTKYFSGGWRMRISLARALFIEPTLLMLDEPTNHLDLNAVIWLDDYLQKWKKTLLVVSHDQDFLNSVCQEIIHLDDKKLVVYKGNYDTFKEQEAVKLKQQIKAWEKQEKRLKELKAKGLTKENAEKAQLKSKAREPGARAKKAEAAAAASGGLESGESQVELMKRPRDYTVTFSFPEVTIISPPIMEVRDVNFRYGPDLPWLFRGVNFGLDMASRVCIVGPNGSGKSTIIKIITGEVNPPEGEVRRNPRLRVGIYNQHFVDRLPMDEDPVSYLRRLFNEESYQSVRNKLGKYGLEGHAHTIPIRDLSGGQKARVVFVELSFLAPHLLFLDEPTNNLDIESIDALCDALKQFNGGVVMVSHDARLIETTDCQLWVVEDQNVEPWPSGFKGYREHLLRKLEAQMDIIIAGGGERQERQEKRTK